MDTPFGCGEDVPTTGLPKGITIVDNGPPPMPEGGVVDGRSARLTVTEMVYHSSSFGEPTVSEHGYARGLNDEEPYSRYKLAVDKEWTTIPCGHVIHVKMIVLVNKEGL